MFSVNKAKTEEEHSYLTCCARRGKTKAANGTAVVFEKPKPKKAMLENKSDMQHERDEAVQSRAEPNRAKLATTTTTKHVDDGDEQRHRRRRPKTNEIEK